MITLDKIKKEIIPILRKHHVERASLFGSVVTGKIHDGSDIDILVQMPTNASLLDRAKIKIAIEDALHMPADVLRFDSIKPHARESILASQIPLSI